MKKTFLIIACFIFLGVISCSKDSSKAKLRKDFFTIPFARITSDQGEIPLSSFAKDVTIVQLENSPLAVTLGKIEQVVLTKDYIFVLHGSETPLSQFNRKGRFIRNIGSVGAGPEQFNGFLNISVDEINQLIYVFSGVEQIAYNFEGDFVKKVNLKVNGFYSVNRSDSTFVSYLLPWDDSFSYQFIESSSTIDTLQAMPRCVNWNIEGATHFYFSMYPMFYRFQERLHMKSMSNDTVYWYNEKRQLEPKYSIDMIGRKLDYEKIYTKTGTLKLNKHTCVFGALETENYVFLPYSEPVDIMAENTPSFKGCVLYNKIDRTGVAVKESEMAGFYNDISGGPRFIPSGTRGKELFSVIPASEFKSFSESEEFDSQHVVFPKKKRAIANLASFMTSDDNCLIMIVKMK